MPAVTLKDLSKRYRIYPRQQDRLKEILSFGKIKVGHDFWALKDVNLEVEQGTTMGVLGRNGAGKSTLLQIVSGVLQPTSGSVEINGRLAALLQLGAGFNPEFTGRENVIMNGLILGLDRREMLDRFDEIEAFADLGEFMDQAVKTYSSGMRARLGFAVAVNVEPDILIVDETLSVGDAIFRQTGLQKMRSLRDSGTTIFFVSHSTNMVKNFCNKAVLLHKGNMVAHGETGEITDRYDALISTIESQRGVAGAEKGQAANYEVEDFDEASSPTFKEDPDLKRRTARFRHGTGEARITKVEILDDSGLPTGKVFLESAATVRVYVEFLEKVKGTSVNIVLRNKAALDVFSTSTKKEGVRIGRRRKGEQLVVDFSLNMMLQPGVYGIAAAISQQDSRNTYMDWVDVGTTLEIERPQNRGGVGGLVHIPTEIKVHSFDQKQQSKSA